MAGAIDFESEFPKSSGTFLSQEQRNQLFEKLKHVVVIVNTEAVTPEGRKVLRGAGVILDKNGTMLTSEYLVAAKQQTILVRRVVDEVFWEAIVVKSDPKLDLAVLVPKNNAGRFHFATMDTEEKFDIGKEVISISHSGNFLFTLMIGHLACRDHRIFFDVVNSQNEVYPLLLDRDVKLMQINNFHGFNNAMGAPVFSSSGKLIGLTTLVWKKFDFAIHLTVLKEFYGAYTKGKGKGKEKEEFTKGKGKEKEEFYGSHSKGKGKGKAK